MAEFCRRDAKSLAPFLLFSYFKRTTKKYLIQCMNIIQLSLKQTPFLVVCFTLGEIHSELDQASFRVVLLQKSSQNLPIRTVFFPFDDIPQGRRSQVFLFLPLDWQLFVFFMEHLVESLDIPRSLLPILLRNKAFPHAFKLADDVPPFGSLISSASSKDGVTILSQVNKMTPVVAAELSLIFDQHFRLWRFCLFLFLKNTFLGLITLI